MVDPIHTYVQARKLLDIVTNDYETSNHRRNGEERPAKQREASSIYLTTSSDRKPFTDRDPERNAMWFQWNLHNNFSQINSTPRLNRQV